LYGGKVIAFDWDQSNLAHIALHDVTPEEAEQVVVGNSIRLAVVILKGEERTICGGRTSVYLR